MIVYTLESVKALFNSAFANKVGSNLRVQNIEYWAKKIKLNDATATEIFQANNFNTQFWFGKFSILMNSSISEQSTLEVVAYMDSIENVTFNQSVPLDTGSGFVINPYFESPFFMCQFLKLKLTCPSTASYGNCQYSGFLINT